ncbi:MAG: DUF2116 family Zn-ribbon domain-containing protein [Thermoplasmatota archaeon]
MVAGVPEHAHCEICGMTVTVGTRVCSPACQEKLDEATKMKKRSAYLVLGLVIASLALARLF